MSTAPSLARGCGKVCHPDKRSAQEHATRLITTRKNPSEPWWFALGLSRILPIS